MNNPDVLVEEVIPKALDMRRQWVTDGEIVEARIRACWPALRSALAAIPYTVYYTMTYNGINVSIFGLESIKDTLPFLEAIETAVDDVFDRTEDQAFESFASRKFRLREFPLEIEAVISSNTSETCRSVPDGVTIVTKYKLVCE